jgi:DNA-directed RNA polymerase specialized sigma24 family protein
MRTEVSKDREALKTKNLTLLWTDQSMCPGRPESFSVQICISWVRFSLLKSSLLLGEKRFNRIPAPSMNDREEAQKRLCIRERDSHGNTVDKRLIDAAHRIWESVRMVVIRYLTEDTEAPEILEAAVESASRAMHNGKSIESFEAYLRRSVRRESARRFRKNRRIQYMDRTDIERLAGGTSPDMERELDKAKRIELFRACLDECGRTMFDLRVLHHGWRSIAKLTGYANAQTATVQFRKKMDKALERFQAHLDSRLRPQSKV